MAVRRHRPRPVAVVAIAIATLAIWAGAPAVAATTAAVGPNQAFVGTVNHRTGRQQPAQVRVACPGPQRPGQMTHPLANQPLEVVRASASNTNAGFTGAHGTHISTYLGIPPSTPASSSTAMPTFYRYGVSKPIPTSISVPCSGKAYITFMPWPRDPGHSRAFVVPIEYVNIAV